MRAVLYATCACGRTVVAPCPTLEEPDRVAAHAAIEAAGFEWDERHGYRCNHWPDCTSLKLLETSPVPVSSRQQDLFGGNPNG